MPCAVDVQRHSISRLSKLDKTSAHNPVFLADYRTSSMKFYPFAGWLWKVAHQKMKRLMRKLRNRVHLVTENIDWHWQALISTSKPPAHECEATTPYCPKQCHWVAAPVCRSTITCTDRAWARSRSGLEASKCSARVETKETSGILTRVGFLGVATKRYVDDHDETITSYIISHR